MGHMSSPVKAIEHITFAPFPTKPTAGLRIVRVYNTIVGVGPNGIRGTVFTTAAVKRAVFCVGNWNWSENITACLKKLQVLSPEEIASHEAYLARNSARDDAVTRLGDATRAAKDPASGVTLKHLQAMWNALDAVGQWRAARYKYQPAGTKRGCLFLPST